MRKALVCLAVSLIACTARARWMTPEEADYSIEELSAKVEIPADGRATTQSTVRLKILNETGRSSLGTVRFHYSPKNTELEVKRAEIKNGDKTYKVEKQFIADQAIRGAEAGFDDLRQVMVSFPQVQVGSEMYYALKTKTIRASIPGQYTQKIYFGLNGFDRNSEYNIVSEKRLNIVVNDPLGAVEILKDESGKKFTYIIRLKKPVFHRVFEEQQSLLQESTLTWVAVSTANTYTDLLSDLRAKYEAGLNEKLPESFAKIRDAAREGELSEKKLGLVLALLADRVRYMGDWRAVDGALVPRSFEKMDQTRSGDCKDMSMLTTKILRELGFQAWVALVFRGSNPPSLDPKAPHFGFNHAIVFVQLRDRKLWLDPTNFQSFPDGVFEDIAEREAIVLRPGPMDLQKIEFGPPEATRETVDAKLRLTSKGTTITDMILSHSGNLAIPETGILLRISKAQFNERLISSLSSRSDVLDYKIESPELKSRILTTTKINVTMERVLRPMETSMGPAIEFSAPEFLKEFLKMEPKQRDSAFRLGPPQETASTVEFSNLNSKGAYLKNCEVKSPWLDYAFKVSTSPLKVIRQMRVRRYTISAAEIKTPEFLKFQDELKKCSRAKYVVYSKK